MQKRCKALKDKVASGMKAGVLRQRIAEAND